MSTVAVFNGFGQYEMKNDGQKGITLKHGGVEFWFPYDEVTYLPDFTMREVDHRESSSEGDEESVLIYKTFRISGNRLAEELTETQIPYANSKKGIIVISSDRTKRKDSYVEVFAGVGDDGTRLTTEVQEVVPSDFEIEDAHVRAREYKEEIVQLYFQAKRERLAGGHGPIFPTGLIKVYMKEMGVKDIDDVTRQLETAAATPGISTEQLLTLIKSVIEAAKPVAVAAPVPVPAAPTALKAKETVESLIG
jgi:hypothetical protein